MKFAALATALVAAASANAAALETRDTITPECYASSRGLVYERGFVTALAWACRKSADRKPGNPWASKLCVAAAVAAGPSVMREQLTCEEPTLAAQSQLPNLDYNVYASIVGDCAWAPNGCDVTRQNLIDLVYSQIGTETEQKPVWPGSADELVRYYINQIFRWTATSPTNTSTPYTNFNDWLHYAPDMGHCNQGAPSGCPPGEIPPWQNA